MPDPLRCLGKWGRLEGQDVIASAHVAAHEAGALEHPDVLGRRVERDRKVTGDIGDSSVRVGQTSQDGAAGRVGHRREDPVELSSGIFTHRGEYSVETSERQPARASAALTRGARGGTVARVLKPVSSKPVVRGVSCLVAVTIVTTACSAFAGGASSPGETLPPIATIPTSDAPTGGDLPGSTAPTADTSTATTALPVVEREVLADISMTSVPRDVIVPTNETSLDAVTNPINGRRGGRRPPPEDLDCLTGTAASCLAATLDILGFDVTSGSSEDRERSVQRATAVVQLDAGLPMTGVPDDDVVRYLGLTADSTPEARADEVRKIGSSAKGRPIMAMRFGNGPRTVLVVGQTHGDEEGGRRVLLRALSLTLPDEITLWVVPTMNPDGAVLDTRFLANGTDPNRRAPGEPEQQAVYEFALDVQPTLSIWYHQNYGWVGGSGLSLTPARQYQELTGLGTLKRSGDCAKGFMWCPIDDALGSSSILVELPDVLTPADVQIHALALLAVASGEAD
jgi:hypothetical protein